MGAVKSLREKMADEGLKSFIVTATYEWADYPMYQQFWATDAAHAGEQAEDVENLHEILLIETQDEYEARNGVKLDYGRTENR